MRRLLAAVLAWLMFATAAVAYPSETFRAPPVTVHDFRFPGEVPDRPTMVAGYLLDVLPRAPWLAECYGAIYDLAVWQDERPDCPTSLRTVDAGGAPVRKAGNTWWYTAERRGRVELNGQYSIRATLLHELGHVGQHRFGVLGAGHPDATPEGRLMFAVWAAMPGPDDEEAFAAHIQSHLSGSTWSSFARWFPLVLAVWRPRAGYVWDALFYSEGGVSFWQWWDSQRVRLERYQDGRHLQWDGYQWLEVQP
jgi:hypothetical protein